MKKQMLRCDICGGELEMQGGGKAVCTSCGMKYSTESLREKFNGLKVSVTGSREDVEQWKQLVKTYLDNCDFISAEKTIKRILEAKPNDSYGNELYTKLQEWKYLEVVNYVLVNYSGKAIDLELPEGIREVGSHAFGAKFGEAQWPETKRPIIKEGSELKSIVIPPSVIRICEGAFCNCTQLNSVFLSEGLQEIGDSAFSGCVSLNEIEVPQSVMTIGKFAFHGCRALQSISIPEDLVLQSYAFSSCDRLSEVIFAKGSKIADYAFSDCISLEKVGLPDALEEVAPYAFKGSGIKEISFPKSLRKIRQYAFSECDSLVSIVLPDGVTELEEHAFENCKMLHIVRIPDTVKNIGDNCFSRCKRLDDVSWAGINDNFIRYYELDKKTEEEAIDNAEQYEGRYVFGEHRRSPFSFTPYWEKLTKLREHTCPFCGGEIETKKAGSLFNKQYETTCKKCGKKIYKTYNEWYLMPDKWRNRTSR